jgi:hypothetical protein
MFEIVMGIDDFLIQLVKYCTPLISQSKLRWRTRLQATGGSVAKNLAILQNQ